MLWEVATNAASLAIGALAAAVIWRWFVYSDDDDDEMYFACFKPSASPVATPHAFLKILERMPKGTRILDVGIGVNRLDYRDFSSSAPTLLGE